LRWVVAREKPLSFSFGYLKEAAVFGCVWEVHLIVNARPVNPVGGFDAFVTRMWRPIVVVVDDGMVACLND
jgi:hypothetical protein